MYVFKREREREREEKENSHNTYMFVHVKEIGARETEKESE